MPVYELVLLIQKLEREALKNALKRAANYIFQEDGVIRKIENLGFRELPFKMRVKGKSHNAANYFIFSYDVGTTKPKEVLYKFKLDSDIVRATNFVKADTPVELHKKKVKPECTLQDDLLPPPLRPTVIKLQEIGKRKKIRYLGENLDDPEFIIK